MPEMLAESIWTEQEEEVVVNKGEVSHVVRETRVDIGSQLYDVLISM